MLSVMNMKVFRTRTEATLPIVMLAALFGFVSPATASPVAVESESEVVIEEGVPGGAITSAVKVNAEVIAIDHFNRNVTLLRPDGETVTVNVGSEAVNFNKVMFRTTEMVVIEIDVVEP